MIDIKLIRENPELVKKNLKKRFDNSDKLIDEILDKDKEWRKLKLDADNLRADRNKISEQINQAKKQKDEKKAQELIKKAKDIPEQIAKIEEKEKSFQEQIKQILLKTPNLIDDSVPVGENDEANKVVKKFGKTDKKKTKPSDEIMTELDLLDMEQAAKVSGSRFYYLKGDLARLDYALMCFAMDILRKKGFVVIEPPLMINREAYEGAVILNDFEEVIYKIEGEDLYLIATSEHAIAALHKDQILDLKKPLKYAGISPCFRKEAGSHGKDTKGIFRVHQFNKIEQFVYSTPEESWKIHEEMISNAEEIFKKLGLPYRVVLLSSGDMGKVSAKTYDLEVWIPSQQKYREAVSCSNCTDYQARRLNIRYQKDGKLNFCHTLNSTAVATGRALVAIIENYLQKDGSIKIPTALVPYMAGLKKIEAKKK